MYEMAVCRDLAMYNLIFETRKWPSGLTSNKSNMLWKRHTRFIID